MPDRTLASMIGEPEPERYTDMGAILAALDPADYEVTVTTVAPRDDHPAEFKLHVRALDTMDEITLRGDNLSLMFRRVQRALLL